MEMFRIFDLTVLNSFVNVYPLSLLMACSSHSLPVSFLPVCCCFCTFSQNGCCYVYEGHLCNHNSVFFSLSYQISCFPLAVSTITFCILFTSTLFAKLKTQLLVNSSVILIVVTYFFILVLISSSLILCINYSFDLLPPSLYSQSSTFTLRQPTPFQHSFSSPMSLQYCSYNIVSLL